MLKNGGRLSRISYEALLSWLVIRSNVLRIFPNKSTSCALYFSLSKSTLSAASNLVRRSWHAKPKPSPQAPLTRMLLLPCKTWKHALSYNKCHITCIILCKRIQVDPFHNNFLKYTSLIPLLVTPKKTLRVQIHSFWKLFQNGLE